MINTLSPGQLCTLICEGAAQHVWSFCSVCSSVSSSDDLLIDWVIFLSSLGRPVRFRWLHCSFFSLWQPGEPQELLFSEWILYSTSVFPILLKQKMYFIDSNVSTFDILLILLKMRYIFQLMTWWITVFYHIKNKKWYFYLFLLVHKLIIQFTVDVLYFMNCQIFSSGAVKHLRCFWTASMCKCISTQVHLLIMVVDWINVSVISLDHWKSVLILMWTSRSIR